VTVVSALVILGGTLSLTPLLGLLPVAVAMIAGAVSAAYVGTALVHRVSEHLLERVILVFLVVIGTALIVEAFLPQDVPERNSFAGLCINGTQSVRKRRRWADHNI
jgi:uncharacterized protein